MVKKILSKNLDSLKNYQPFLASYFDSLDFSEIKCDGISFEEKGKKYLIHSLCSPEDEAETLIEDINFKKDNLIVLFGLGLGWHIFELKKNISDLSKVIIVEHNIEVLKYAFTNIDFSAIFKDGQFFLVFGDEKQQTDQLYYMMNYRFQNLSFNINIIMLPNYHVYYQSNQKITNHLMRMFSMSIISHGNALDDMFVGFTNNYLNIDAFVKSNSIDEIRNKFQRLPAIVVSAGPSLDKNIHLLKNAYGKALIIACDASLRACEKQNVKPDAVASIERDEPTYTYYYKDKKIDKDIVLVAPGVLWPEIYSEYKGKTIIMAKSPEGPEGWWMSHFDAVKFVNQGQSSATVAFAVAQAAGCNPVILIGQDLAFTGEKKHSEFTHTEFEGENDDREFDGIYLEDVDGNLIKSDWVFKLFKDWFEYKIIASPDLKVIDATEGGAYIKGSEVMRFEEAIEKYCINKKEKKLIEYLSDVEVSSEKYLGRYESIIISISKEIEKIMKIKAECKKHNNRLLRIYKNHKLGTCAESELVKIVLEMKKGDKLIRSIKKCKFINAYFNQIIQQTIIYVKAIGNELNNNNVKRNYFLQRNLMYMIIESADLIINEYKKANEFIIQKKEK